jgi:DNA ligase-1
MYKIIDELSLTSSKLSKEAIILREAQSGNTEFFNGFRMAYDPMITFGVKQVPEKLTPNRTGDAFNWNNFVQLSNALSTRQLTGHDARDAIEDAMNRSTVADWNGWYRRILIKDMRCGTS